MNDYSTESPRPVLNQSDWHLAPREEVPQTQTVEREAQWKEFDNSVNAVSFGFVATAILISMFLVMAIFERFLRPRSSSFVSARHRGERSRDLDSVQSRAQMRLLDKLDHSPNVSSPYTIGVSVIMPGQNMPTFIAHPMPLPCPREGVSWPMHEKGFYLGSCSIAMQASSMHAPKSNSPISDTSTST